MKRRINRNRQPQELLADVHTVIMEHCEGQHLDYQEGEDEWVKAAFDAIEDVSCLQADLLADPPTHRRRYFGPVGGLRNNQH